MEKEESTRPNFNNPHLFHHEDHYDENTEKFRYVCERILHLLNETGDFSPNTRRYLTLANISFNNRSNDLNDQLSLTPKNRKRKSDTISTKQVELIQGNTEMTYANSWGFPRDQKARSNNENITSEYIYYTDYNTPQKDIKEYYYNMSNDRDGHSPTVSPLPRSYSPSIGGFPSYTISKNEQLFDGFPTSTNNEIVNQNLNQDAFSQDFTNYYFNDA